MSLERLRDGVHADPALQIRLSKIDDRREFVTACLSVAAELGLNIETAELQNAMQAGRRTWMERDVPVYTDEPPKRTSKISEIPTVDWIPFFLRRHSSGLQLEWGYVGDKRLEEPFFHQTLTALMRKPFNEVFRRCTPLDTLLEHARRLPGLPPAGLVFHMSRCGSTLVAQTLASLPDSVVLSEAEPLDVLFGLLNESDHLNEDERLTWIRVLVSALGQPRRPADRRLFIKLDAWHMDWAHLWLRAYPDTPWIFLYREPVEVLVSHRRMPGSQLIPGVLHPSFVVPASDSTEIYRPVEYGSRVLSKILNAAEFAMQNYSDGGLVNYKELPSALWTSIADHFRLELSPTELAVMQESSRRDAKEPFRTFNADSSEKQREVTPYIRALADRWLESTYSRLEAQRTAAGDLGSGSKSK